MEISGPGKSPSSSFSFRYNANNEELEELFDVCEDDPPTPQFDASPSIQSENASPKRGEKTSSILEKYFKSIRTEKLDDVKPMEPKETKVTEESRTPPKEVTLSPMKEYLNRLSKRNTTEAIPEVKEGSNETWKIFSDFRFKITQAVEDMKTRSLEETKEKSVPRENSISDSEDNSAIKDSDISVGDTDNQISSLDSSMQNLSELTQPLTAKAIDHDTSLPNDNQNSESSDDTHKNIIHSYPLDVTRIYHNVGNVVEVESGVEALEDSIGFCDMPTIESQYAERKPIETVPTMSPQKTDNFGLPPPNKNNLKSQALAKPKTHFFNFTMYFLTFVVFLNFFLFPNCNVWNGFLLGLWVYCFTSNLKQWLADKFFGDWDHFVGSFLQLNRCNTNLPMYTIPSVKEHRPMKKYEGWINHYRFPDYDPFSYRINRTTTAFMKLEGCNLRISYTTKKIAKRAQCEEKIDKVIFYQHRLYNLTGARVILLPNGLVKRRQWSKKYPICIILSEQEKIQVLEKESVAAERRASEMAAAERKREHVHEMESAETNTSPEKKKKFVWRRRDKSSSHSDGETGREGLRHRLVRKMHRDKKTDSVSTCTEPPESLADKQLDDASFHDAEMELTAARPSVSSTRDDADDELDDTELSKIKDFLEEAELDMGTEGTLEGEWSLHVKHSRDKHARLYLFGRTGRDKHEWFRRLTTAIAEANIVASAETSAADENTNESAQEGKVGIEMAVYKLSEKETVAFAKASNKPLDSVSDGVTITAPAPSVTCDIESQEKAFWPYMLKIIQAKGESPTCECRVLPLEVTWVNTVLARMVYDVMRDPVMIARIQTRIQKKLHTLKLPSFMSPLVVTELSLVGACPMVERVSLPSWDDRGLWLDADLRYEGGAYINILTQINLMKLKEKNITLEDRILEETDIPSALGTKESKSSHGTSKNQKPAIYDSEVEDSAESSSDDESPPLQPVDSVESVTPSEAAGANEAPASSKKKFLRMVDKIATNKYFQQVTDYKYVKRAMEGLSNTDIKLQLEVHGLEGRLAINLPPPPHDRIWLGFRSNPQLVLKARPAVGARTLRFAHISNWIEQKLTKEFEKVLVLPNMEDFIVDVMTPTPVEFE